MDLSFLVIQALSGLASASALFVIASGLTIVFGVTRIVSRCGSIISQCYLAHNQENFRSTLLEDICVIIQTHDVALSLRYGHRRGSTAAANAEAQFREAEPPG